MKLHEFSYRELSNQIILLPFNENDSEFIEVAEIFPRSKQSNGLILYGYIDHELGLTFEVLCAAKYRKGQVILYPGKDEISIKFSSDSIRDREVFFLHESLPSEHNDKTKALYEEHQPQRGLHLCRQLQELDPHRSATHPDEVAVIFYDQNKEPEYCWVRCEDCRPPHIIGTILTEPKRTPGIHRGEKVAFGLYKVSDKMHIPVFLR